MTAVATLTCACKKGHPLSDPAAGGTLCGALTRQEGAKYPSCHRPAGWGTDHSGAGKCKLHGGASLVKSGRYTRLVTRVRVRELMEEMENDPDPLNMLPELGAARAIFIDFIERYDVWREALLAWHADWQLQRRPLPQDLLMSFGNVIDEYEIRIKEAAEPSEKQKSELAGARKFLDYMRGTEPAIRPREVLDVSAAMSHVDTITKIVERIERVRSENAISRKDFQRLVSHFAASVQKRVTDEATLKGIHADWMDAASSFV